MRGPRPEAAHRGAGWATGAIALTVGLLFGALLLVLPGGFATTVVDDLTQLLAPTLASVLCWRTSRRVDGTDRRLWRWLAAATGAWACGQVVWSWYELVLRVEPPFPSWADIGFLAFPLLAAAGLLLWHGGPYLKAGTRDLIDGGLIAGALLMLSWKTALGSVFADGGSNTLGFTLALAYPVGDLVSATVVLLLIVRAGVGSRPHVALLAAGLLSLAVADSAYVYLVSEGAYATGNVISAGWVTGFLLIAAAALVARRAPQGTADRRPASRGLLALPYVAVALAVATVVHSALRAPLTVPEVALAATLASLLLVRQYLVLRDNESLLQALTAREAALAHEVMHDGLTGLSNRAMLLQRLEQLLALHHRDGRGLVLMFCDLDDFKGVNDTLGHLAGDGVLREVAARMSAGLRGSDTVARPSGDEFAVIMEPPYEDPLRVAGRLIASLTEPILLPEGEVRTGVSVGVAVVLPGDGGGTVTSRALMAAADSAMYSAKSGGKNRAVMVEVGGPGDDEDAGPIRYTSSRG